MQPLSSFAPQISEMIIIYSTSNVQDVYLSFPLFCSFNLMTACWQSNPSSRPTFVEIVSQIDRILDIQTVNPVNVLVLFKTHAIKGYGKSYALSWIFYCAKYLKNIVVLLLLRPRKKGKNIHYHLKHNKTNKKTQKEISTTANRHTNK